MSIETVVITLADAKKLLTKIPFFIEEYDEKFWPVEIMETYTKKVSPFFSQDVVGTIPIPTSIAAITTAAPVYVRSHPNFKITRDPAELNVHSALRNEFWQTLFRDAFGTEANSLIIAAFNRLRYIYASEENLLFSFVFKQLFSMPDSSEMVLAFDEDDDTNVTLVKEKLEAAYALLNYEANYSSFIDSWLDSVYLSGQLSTIIEKKREANIYAVQDIKAELLRRKFAGTASLYSIILSSMNRRGTYAPTVAVKTVYSDANFKDNRAIRALDLPGITTVAPDIIIDPILAFENLMPIRTLTPLYYTSSNYNSEEFEQRKADYLRYRSPEIVWDNINGILDASLVKLTYPRLDQVNPNLPPDLYKMDTKWVDPITALLRPIILDDSQPSFNLSTITSGFFDIQADQLLFHENTAQKIRRHEYPFATYNISEGTGPCMMDIPWLDYIERSVSRKKRVQEKVDVGVQISKYAGISPNLIEEMITVITFSEDFEMNFDAQAAQYTPNMQYAYLWNVRISYNIHTFAVQEVKKELITYIKFVTDISGYSPEAITTLSRHPSYEEFSSRSVGLLPFAYPTLNTNAILSLEMRMTESEIRDDFYEEGYHKAVFLFTPFENVAISKRYIKSHPGILIASNEWFVTPHTDDALKHMIYGVERQNEDTGAFEWFWSDPVRLYPKALANITTFHPDWMHMVMYINPYLNFTRECSSPIRRKPVPTRGLRPIDLPDFPQPETPLPPQIGPGPDTALCNLNVVHGMNYYCNNTGGETPTDHYPQGSYLRKIRPVTATLDTESFQIWGDNRATGDTVYTNDPLDKWSEGTVRSTQFKDPNGIPCLLFAQGAAYVEGIPVDSYYQISPSKSAIRTADWAQWQWNSTDNTGMTVCVDLAIADVNADQWFFSRNEATVNTVHAEADFYLEAPVNGNRDLVFKVYPEGTLTGTVFEVRLNANHIIGKQSQIGASYKTVLDKEDVNILQITMSVVADRKWVEKRYVTKYLSPTTHELYSDVPEDFSIGGITPTIVTLSSSYDYTAGYVAPNVYRFGKLQKYQGQPDNELRVINVLNYRAGLKPMRGYLYDYRLYKMGVNALELIVFASGTRRELYSYSPIFYKLAYQHSIDTGIMKRARRKGVEISENIGRVRIFERGVWDSILTDLYPMSAEEADPLSVLYRPDWKDPLDDKDVYDGLDYKDGVVEQLLVPNYETMSDVTLGSTNLFYRGQPVTVDPTTRHSLVQTSIYPMKYNQEMFTSGLVLARDPNQPSFISFKAYHNSNPPYGPTAQARPAEIPSVPSGDTLEYRLSLDLNFLLQTQLDASAPMVFGPNLAVKRDEAFVSKFVITHRVPTTKAVASNYLVYPLYIPNQGPNEYAIWNGTFTGFSISNFRLNLALSKLLDANSFYGEYQVPCAYDNDNSPIGSSYTSRWTAVKGLRDGEYYITCKYPVQILPMANADLAIAKDLAILYAAARLKIVVRSTPKYYTEPSSNEYNRKWDIASDFIPEPYRPTDNRTFPHRQVNIDLYVMDNIGTEAVEIWSWHKIASNYDTTSGVQLLTNISESTEIAITKEIPFFFTKNFTAPFFTRGATSTDVISDVTYFRIENVKRGKENLRATTLTDLNKDKLTLLSSRSYRMLLDFSASVTEVSFSANIFTDTTKIDEQLSTAELTNYARLTSLLDSVVTISREPFLDVGYEGQVNWSYDSTIDVNLTSTKTGYAINATNEFIAANTDVEGNNLALGDPYSNAASKNLLVSIFADRRAEIAENFYFPYRQEDVSINTVFPPRLFGSRIDDTTTYDVQVISKMPGGGYFIARRNFDEFNYLKNLYVQKIESVRSSIKNLRNSSGGIISSFASIKPTYSNNTILQETITPSTHTLKAFLASSFPVPLLASIPEKSTAPGLYTTNLVQSQDFTNTDYYIVSPVGAGHNYVYDAEKDRDVFSLHTGTGIIASLQYLKDPGASAVYENAISLKTPITIEVAVQYKLINGTVWTSNYTTVSTLNMWVVLNWETPTALDPINVTFLFRKPASTAFENEQILISKIFVRKAPVFSHRIGFSEAIIAGTATAISLGSRPPVIEKSVHIAFLHNNLKTLFPIQVMNKTLADNEPTYLLYTTQINNFIQTYIPTQLKSSTRDIVDLIRPWTRRIVFQENNPKKIRMHKLANEPKSFTVRFIPTSTVGDIFEVYNDYENEANRSIRYNAIFNAVEFAGEKGLVLNLDAINLILKSNLIVDTTSIPVVEERFSLVSGCVNPDKFLAGSESVVSITNIQLMDASPTESIILYEMEYFPIIYDESRHHLSLNFLLRSN